MRNRRYRIGAMVLPVLLAVGLAARAQGRAGENEPPRQPDRPWETIDVALVLDTSGSMKNLLKSAQIHLWEIVGDLTRVEPSPRLRVAIVTYGSRLNGSANDWIRVETDFTEDLDFLSETLFEIEQDHGGTELVARAVLTSIEQLSWTASDEALKLLFVAGNEEADQDEQVSLDEIIDRVEEERISLQLLFCGSERHQAAESWIELAEWSRGRFASIDHRRRPVAMRTPFDVELAELSRDLNRTYLPMGEEGREMQDKSIELDEKVQKLSPSAAASRVEVKSSPVYTPGWDLVDAVESGAVDLYEIEAEVLPEQMREMTPLDRETYIQEMGDRRRELRDRIAELSAERRSYLASEVESKRIDTSRTFDTVVREALRVELEERGFRASGR